MSCDRRRQVTEDDSHSTQLLRVTKQVRLAINVEKCVCAITFWMFPQVHYPVNCEAAYVVVSHDKNCTYKRTLQVTLDKTNNTMVQYIKANGVTIEWCNDLSLLRTVQ